MSNVKETVTYLEYLDEHKDHLINESMINKWEYDFIESVFDFYQRREYLTEGQAQKIDDIHTKVRRNS